MTPNRHIDVVQADRIARASRQMADWLDHARGCRRRAHDYRRAGCPDKSADQWVKAFFALSRVRIHRDELNR